MSSQQTCQQRREADGGRRVGPLAGEVHPKEGIRAWSLAVPERKECCSAPRSASIGH
jgi:hypothetical protein